MRTQQAAKQMKTKQKKALKSTSASTARQRACRIVYSVRMIERSRSLHAKQTNKQGCMLSALRDPQHEKIRKQILSVHARV